MLFAWIYGPTACYRRHFMADQTTGSVKSSGRKQPAVHSMLLTISTESLSVQLARSDASADWVCDHDRQPSDARTLYIV